MKTFLLAFFTSLSICLIAQSKIPCSDDNITNRMISIDPNFIAEQSLQEEIIQEQIKKIVQDRLDHNYENQPSEYTIPVVLHVFHFGNDGMISEEQAISGLEVVNTDIKGLNDDWNTIDIEFESIKATLDIDFCLATIDPDGEPTNGIIYYEDEQAMTNSIDLFQFAWDNYKYINIYLPKYAFGGPSDFTAYAYYPSTAGSNANQGGIVYSSIRWGYGDHSELEPGQEWASVATHEVGHWLDLRHTFQNNCSPPGDLIDDTPPTIGDGLHTTGCYNNDFSCGVRTNGENYMDYNHDCKKMFTQGQVDRMTAAMALPSRAPLWAESNLIATGCFDATTGISSILENRVTVYPNPASHEITFTFDQSPSKLSVYNTLGMRVFDQVVYDKKFILNIANLNRGLYLYVSTDDRHISSGEIVIQ